LVNRPQGAAAGEDPAATSPPSFEEAFAQAEKAVEGLERGALSLEESLRTYEDGLRALRHCYETLARAEKKIEVLGSELGAVGEGANGPAWIPATSLPELQGALGSLERGGELPQEGPLPRKRGQEDAASLRSQEMPGEEET
jgi:exodeoxyribonuclease VII small subunit